MFPYRCAGILCLYSCPVVVVASLVTAALTVTLLSAKSSLIEISAPAEIVTLLRVVLVIVPVTCPPGPSLNQVTPSQKKTYRDASIWEKVCSKHARGALLTDPGSACLW